MAPRPWPGSATALDGRDEHSTRTADLVDHMRAGDREARERLFESHRLVLEARARAHPLSTALRSRPEPSDLAHDTLVRALASGFFSRFEDRGRGSLRNALFRILDRTILDALRREQADKRNPNGAPRERDEVYGRSCELPETMPDEREPTPTSEARAREWTERCRSLLPDREWEVWSEVEIRGSAPADVARAAGISESAARGLLFRARERILRSLCDEEG